MLRVLSRAGAVAIIAVPLNQRLAIEELVAIGAQIEPRAIFYGPEFEQEAEHLAEMFGSTLIATEYRRGTSHTKA